MLRLKQASVQKLKMFKLQLMAPVAQSEFKEQIQI